MTRQDSSKVPYLPRTEAQMAATQTKRTTHTHTRRREAALAIKGGQDASLFISMMAGVRVPILVTTLEVMVSTDLRVRQAQLMGPQVLWSYLVVFYRSVFS